MSTGPSELSAWRAAVVRIINDKVTRLVPAGTLTYADMPSATRNEGTLGNFRGRA
jgi:hypothetical protein